MNRLITDYPSDMVEDDLIKKGVALICRGFPLIEEVVLPDDALTYHQYQNKLRMDAWRERVNAPRSR